MLENVNFSIYGIFYIQTSIKYGKRCSRFVRKYPIIYTTLADMLSRVNSAYSFDICLQQFFTIKYNLREELKK